MSIKNYLTEHIKKHPSLMPQDVVKLCYQAAFGAEHLLSDVSAAKRYFDLEFDGVEAVDGELCEMISDEVCRVNLAVAKTKGIDHDMIFNAFVSSAKISQSGNDRFVGFLEEAEEVVRSGMCNFSLDEWREFLEKYEAAGMPAVHHSQRYRDAEKPSYRIVNRKNLNI